MIRGIHYFSTELKRKLMSSQGAALNLTKYLVSMPYQYQSVTGLLPENNLKKEMDILDLSYF